MSSDGIDRIYSSQQQVERFSFDEQVVSVFPDMIKRSVPGYPTIVEMIGVLAARYAQPGTNLYDLGCSLGAATLAMQRMVPHQDCRIVAVDNSSAMIEAAQRLIGTSAEGAHVQLHQQDIRDLELENASVIVLNFTLQFLPQESRDELIQRISHALRPGGILVLSEKICFDDARQNDLQQALHHAFKRNNGYSDLEISQKRTALEQVLIPETQEAHEKRLLQAGFASVDTWFRCFNFMSLVAVR